MRPTMHGKSGRAVERVQARPRRIPCPAISLTREQARPRRIPCPAISLIRELRRERREGKNKEAPRALPTHKGLAKNARAATAPRIRSHVGKPDITLAV